MNTFRRSASAFLLASCAAGPMLHAAALPNRLSRNAAQTAPQAIEQSVSPRVRTSTRLGHLNGETRIESMSLVLSPSAAQSAALDQLLADQQNPASPRYHQWLTPTEFGAQFGVSDSDLQVLQNWLTGQGFQVDQVAPSRNRITFSGTSSTVETAFHTELDTFHRGDQTFFENSTAPQIPAALQTVVGSITGLSSFRQRPALRRVPTSGTLSGTLAGQRPQSTSASGSHYIAPFDFRQIYNANGLFNSGNTGAGIKIAVLGQSAVDLNQLTYFQQLTGQTPKAPTVVLVPGTGASTAYQGDETESEADLEYAGGVAPGASILFVYVGNSTTFNNGQGASVADALNYAIVNNLAPILTYSYGGCEIENTSSALQGQENYFRQANAQGQTIVVASGDTGAAGCEDPGVTTAYDGLQTSYPASSAYVTAIGGTSFNDTANAASYWSSTNNAQYGSAIGYIPETVWNENSTSPLSASGGGPSHVFAKPNWQAGTGVPADNARDIPDISFSAAGHDAYLICTSDTSYVNGTSTAQCTATAFGIGKVSGTSLPTPAFAGALAMVLNANNKTSLGNINPLLYSLFSTSPALFHDVTTGNNIDPCVAGTLGCVNGSEGYNATAGYDLATGLGSLDIGAFSSNVAALSAATIKNTALTLSLVGANVTTIDVNANLTGVSGTSPTGTLTFTLDGGTPQAQGLNQGSYSATGIFLVNGNYSVGNHTLVAQYSGDANYNPATATINFTVYSQSGAITLAATPSTVTINSSTAHTGTWTLNTTSTNGYTGIVIYGVNPATGTSLPARGCFLGQADASPSPNATVSTTITYSYSSADCSSSNVIKVFGDTRTAANSAPSPQSEHNLPLLAISFTGLLGSAFLRRRQRWMTGLLALAAVAGTAGLSGCGSGSTPLPSGTTGSGTTSTAPKGTYNLVFSAQDSTRSGIATSTAVTLVIQ
ncbi:protease pro-enzyme activation domain-containing protein [Terriglobus sp.]|uniref:protease pro-enzyme activation domain-containing protein n=1 Tax=Terriglobus sp. TaxID=1889013 RepID=UPI003B004C81